VIRLTPGRICIRRLLAAVMLLPVGGVLETCRGITCGVILGWTVSCASPAAVAVAEEADPVELQSDRFRVAVTPARGGSILAMGVKRNGEWIDVTPDARRPEAQMRASSWLMLPYSNRIRDGKFTFEGREYALANAKNHAIHGDVRNRPWKVVEQTPSRLLLEFDSATVTDFNWPWPILARVEIEVEGDRLVQRLKLENRGDTTMPAGFGWHPYFRRWLSRDGEPVELQFRVTRIHPDGSADGLPNANADGLPDGPSLPLPAELDFSKSRPLGDLRLDACFSGFDGRAEIGWPESGVRLLMECSPNVSHLVCFAPADRPLVAVEPVANATDGVNLLATGAEHSGVIPLAAGKSLDASFTIRAVVD